MPLLQRRNRLCHGHTSGGRGVLRNLTHQRGTADFLTVFQALPAFGCIEDKLDFAILDLVDDMRPTLGDLVDALDLNTLSEKIVRRATRGANSEAAFNSLSYSRDNDRLVGIFHRHKQFPAHWRRHPRADLRLGKGSRKVPVDPHHFAG